MSLSGERGELPWPGCGACGGQRRDCGTPLLSRRLLLSLPLLPPRFTVTDYRERLYTQVVANKKDRGARMAAYFAGAK